MVPSNFLQNTHAGCGNDFLTRQAPFSELSLIVKIENDTSFSKCLDLGQHFTNRRGLLTGGGGYICKYDTCMALECAT